MGQKDRVRSDYVRARSDAEKEDRRQTILSAASDIIREGGSEDFTIGSLARKSGIAKGTIYLYFETKANVMDALFEEHVVSWAETMLEQCHGEMTEVEFTDIFWSCTYSDDLLMKLMITPTTGGNSGSADRSAEPGPERANVTRELVRLIEDCLDLPMGAGWFAISSLYALLIGSAQMDPSLMATMLGREIHQPRHMFSCEETFRRNAAGIIAASRLLSPEPPHSSMRSA